MPRYYVITPEYGEVVPVTDEGQGPMEYGSDVIEIEARNRSEARLLGVHAMRKNTTKYQYYQHCDGNPFAGVTVESAELSEHHPDCDGACCRPWTT